MDKKRKRKYDIFCIGEILWDSLSAGLFLGGAPLNVCLHAHELGMSSGIISRIGDDRLGNEALRRIEQAGVDISLIQKDDVRETGFVEVSLDEKENPTYKITEDVAWDYIAFDQRASEQLGASNIVVFGSLALRNVVSRENIIQYVKSSGALPVLDLNLRHPYYSRNLVSKLLSLARVVKLNREELEKVIEWLNLSSDIKAAVEQLAQRFDLNLVTVTDGSRGAYLWQDGEWIQQKPYQIKVADTVGAGDAYLTALLYGLTEDFQPREILQLANAAGAYVAEKSGATPPYDLKTLTNLIERIEY